MTSVTETGGTSGIQATQEKVSEPTLMARAELVFLRYYNMISEEGRSQIAAQEARVDELDEASKMEARMTALKQKAADKDGTTAMPDDMKAYCDSHNIEYDGSGQNLQDKNQWGAIIASQHQHVSALSNQNEIAMVKLKSTIGKANTGLELANGYITKQRDVLHGIAAR